jgi:ERF superfamily.
MAEEQANIYQKLAKIRKVVEVMKRDTKAYGYSYTKEESILAKITVLMDKYDLSLIPGIVPQSRVVAPYPYKKTKTTAKGDIYEENVNEVLVHADTTWTWVNNLNPDERIVVPWVMVGQQSDASQSFGSGLTYSSRYFLLKYFNISTSNDDPDKFRSEQRKVEAEQGAIVAGQIITTVDGHVKMHLAKNPEAREDILKVVTKYVKNGDYFAIKEPTLATKLMQDIQKTFKNEEIE